MDNTSKKISIIIPVYNTQDYLCECLDSIINQTLKEIEIICVDDNSTDNSLKILEEYKEKDSRIIILKNEGKGAGGGRNTGLKIATGEFLSFIDSDDFFELNMFEEMYNKAKKTNSDIVICNANKYNTNKKIFIDYKNPFIPNEIKHLTTFNYKDIQEEFFNYFSNSVWNKIYKRSFIKDNKIKFQEIERANDVFFVRAALASANIISYVDKYFAHYRVGLMTNIQSNNNKKPDEYIKAIYELKNYLIEKNLYDDLKMALNKLAILHTEYYLNTLQTYPLTCFKLINKLNKTLFKDLGIKMKINYFRLFLNFIFFIKNFRNTEFKIINILGFRFKIKRKKR